MSECKCNKCREACEVNPGWFTPDQIATVAEHMSMTEKELFDKFLAVNWWETDREWGNDHDIFVIAPALSGESPGDMYPSDPRGKCVFYQDGLCGIHPVKPFECEQFIHGEPFDTVHKRHYGVAVQWEDHKEYIELLLGKEPFAKEFYGGGLLGFLGW